MENNEILELTTSAWREKVYIETEEYIIKGFYAKDWQENQTAFRNS